MPLGSWGGWLFGVADVLPLLPLSQCAAWACAFEPLCFAALFFALSLRRCDAPGMPAKHAAGASGFARARRRSGADGLSVVVVIGAGTRARHCHASLHTHLALHYGYGRKIRLDFRNVFCLSSL